MPKRALRGNRLIVGENNRIGVGCNCCGGLCDTSPFDFANGRVDGFDGVFDSAPWDTFPYTSIPALPQPYHYDSKLMLPGRTNDALLGPRLGLGLHPTTTIIAPLFVEAIIGRSALPDGSPSPILNQSAGMFLTYNGIRNFDGVPFAGEHFAFVRFSFNGIPIDPPLISVGVFNSDIPYTVGVDVLRSEIHTDGVSQNVFMTYLNGELIRETTSTLNHIESMCGSGALMFYTGAITSWHQFDSFACGFLPA